MKSATIIFIFLAFFLAGSFCGQAQNFNLMPTATRIIDKQAQQAGGGLSVTTYKFESLKPQKEILKFYRNLLVNEGFTQMKPEKGKTKYTYYFAKQKDNKIVILNFLKFIDKGTSTYYIALHEFDPNVLAKLAAEQRNEEQEQ